MSELNIDLLRTFVAVVDSGSFTKASRTVFRSQAAVSMQVKRLEESIAQPLFVRDTRNLALGQTGKALLPYARRLLNLHHETWTALVQPEVQGQIMIGAPDDYISSGKREATMVQLDFMKSRVPWHQLLSPPVQRIAAL